MLMQNIFEQFPFGKGNMKELTYLLFTQKILPMLRVYHQQPAYFHQEASFIKK